MKILAIYLLAISVGIPHTEVEVITEAEDSYLVTGRFFVTDQSNEAASVARKAASCIGCKWHLQKICPNPSVQENHAGFNCSDTSSYACSANGSRYQVWFLDEGLWRPGDWQLRGNICIGPSGPTPIREVQTEVIESALGKLPALKFDLQPSTKSLVNLPTRAQVKSANQYQFETVVGGVSVQVTATATYRYEFGNFYSITTANRSSAYSFRSDGIQDVKVTAIWSANWSTANHGTNSVSGSPLTQSLTKQAFVLAARGRLVRR